MLLDHPIGASDELTSYRTPRPRARSRHDSGDLRDAAVAFWCLRENASRDDPYGARGSTSTTPPPRLGDRVRSAAHLRHLSPRTEDAYLRWIRRYWEFHGRRDPAALGASEATAFLNALAVSSRVAASTQNQALAALLFLYREVFSGDLPWLDGLVRAATPRRLPVVLSRDEVRRVLSRMTGVPRLMATLLYGSGLRLLECCRLRVKDIDFARNQIIVRRGKGDVDRATTLPEVVKDDLGQHLQRVRAQHQCDLTTRSGWVELPGALARKLPLAGREWTWQWVFPATRHYTHPDTGQRRRHHLHETVVQQAVRRGLLATGIPSVPPAIRSAIRSRRICSRTGATFALSKSSWGTRTWQRR